MRAGRQTAPQAAAVAHRQAGRQAGSRPAPPRPPPRPHRHVVTVVTGSHDHGGGDLIRSDRITGAEPIRCDSPITGAEPAFPHFFQAVMMKGESAWSSVHSRQGFWVKPDLASMSRTPITALLRWQRRGADAVGRQQVAGRWGGGGRGSGAAAAASRKRRGDALGSQSAASLYLHALLPKAFPRPQRSTAYIHLPRCSMHGHTGQVPGQVAGNS